MGRSRGFDEVQVADQAAGAFLSAGFEGTSVDDLVRATGLQRGSLYQAFGSKRGIFLAALRQVTSGPGSFEAPSAGPGVRSALDLLLVAILELAPRDDEVRVLAARALAGTHDPARVLGERLLQRARLDDPRARRHG